MFAMRWFCRISQALASLALVLNGGCVAAPQPSPTLAAMPPIPPGEARLWFYREFFPEDSKDVPAIRLNGNPIGYGYEGVSFYRDVPAGAYHVTADTFGRDFNQDKDIALAPGQLAYIKVQSLPSWAAGGTFNTWRRGTYYIAIVSPQLAALEIPRTSFSGGN